MGCITVCTYEYTPDSLSVYDVFLIYFIINLKRMLAAVMMHISSIEQLVHYAAFLEVGNGIVHLCFIENIAVPLAFIFFENELIAGNTGATGIAIHRQQYAEQ
jgi:hypothetical protein